MGKNPDHHNGIVANVPSSSATRSNSTPSAHSSNEPEGMYKSHYDFCNGVRNGAF